MNTNNPGDETLLAALGLSVAILAPKGVSARTALRLAMLTRAAARFLPLLAARELAGAMLGPLELGEPFLTVADSAIAARIVPRSAGAWSWPQDVSCVGVREAMSEAWRQTTDA